MNSWDFSFEESPWEIFLAQQSEKSTLSAMTVLTMLEGEDEWVFEEALEDLDQRELFLDISDLPKPSGTGDAVTRLRQEEQLAAKGLPIRELDSNDPLRLYLEEVAMTPAFGDEQLLARKSAAGDEAARTALTNLRLSRVIEFAKDHVGKGVLLLDLIQEGSLGLWHAIRTWQTGDFREYSDWWIRQYMAKAVTIQARADGVGQKMRTALEDYRSVDEQLLSELGRNATVEEIAQRLHITPEAAASIGKMLENARLLQQAKRTPEPEEDESEEQQAVEDTAYFQTRQRVNEMLSGLNETEAKVITMRFGLEGGLPLSPEDTGRKLGLTPDEVVAVEAAALEKMRKN